MAEKLLEVKNLRTEFKRDKTWVTAVNNVSFSIQPGEILGLVGESGCGKSVTSLSIMKLLARNSKISNGEILLNGKDLLKEDKKGMRKIRGREVAMIFQEPMNSLNPCMRIEKQLTEAILLHNNFSKEEAHCCKSNCQCFLHSSFLHSFYLFSDSCYGTKEAQLSVLCLLASIFTITVYV